ncbi:M23 family metallopeptidase [Magnetospira thiophila]
MRWLILFFGLLAAAPVRAAPSVSFALPLDCTPGKTCWIANYVDIDASTEAHDYACGLRSYDTHRGTDFALRDLGVMEQGVNVRAAAPGVVAGTRDGMADVNFKKIGRQAIANNECGNGLTIDHGNDWMTQYCHMKKGSLRVNKGDIVTTGQVLGQVGLSGLTEFPHLHFEVWRTGKTEDNKFHREVIDPFLGLTGPAHGTCGLGQEPLWAPDTLEMLKYSTSDIFNAGFAYRLPKPDEVRQGIFNIKELSVLSKDLVFWTDIYGILKGDIVIMQIAGPDGTVLAKAKAAIKKTQARRVISLKGKKKNSDPWPAGSYTGTVLVLHPTTGKKGTGVRMQRSVVLE